MKYGLIGEHLGHSFSKEIHESIAGYEYSLCEVARGELDSFMTRREFSAINVTIPYKEKVLPYLSWISPLAQSVGAVNTIVNRDGQLFGYNTDCDGLRTLILNTGLELNGKKVLILGRGGTSKTATAVARELGAAEIVISARTASEGVIAFGDIPDLCPDAQILINATPCGMYPDNGGRIVDLDIFSQLEGVVDVVYNPLRTNLVLDARERGIKAQGGLLMLVGQAVRAAEHFTGRELPEAVTMDCFRKLAASKENLVLIGMPSCGKSTVGSILAHECGRKIVDTDTRIEERIGMSISEFFALHGEQAFRDIESEVVAETAMQAGLVIATGGGAVLRPENVRALKRNGRLYFLDRPLDLLLTTSDRPLSSSSEALKKMLDIRRPIYKSATDVIIDGRLSPGDQALLIIKENAYK